MFAQFTDVAAHDATLWGRSDYCCATVSCRA